MRWEDQPQRLLDRKTLWNELLLALEVCDLPEVSVGAFEVSVVPPVMALGCAGDTAVSGDGEAQDVVDILPALSLVTEADTLRCGSTNRPNLSGPVRDLVAKSMACMMIGA